MGLHYICSSTSRSNNIKQTNDSNIDSHIYKWMTRDPLDLMEIDETIWIPIFKRNLKQLTMTEMEKLN